MAEHEIHIVPDGIRINLANHDLYRVVSFAEDDYYVSIMANWPCMRAQGESVRASQLELKEVFKNAFDQYKDWYAPGTFYLIPPAIPGAITSYFAIPINIEQGDTIV